MNRLVCFLMVGLAFTVLQATTVEADMIPGTDCAATPGGPEAVAACWDAQAAADGNENPPPSGTSEAGGPPTLTLEDPRCQLAPEDRDPGCPDDPGMAPPMGTAPGGPPTGAPDGPPMGDAPGGPPTGAPDGPPMGDAAAKPSLGERVKSFFGMGTKDAQSPTGAPDGPPMGDAPDGPPTGAPDGPPMGDAPGGPPTGAAPGGPPTGAAPGGPPTGAAPGGPPTGAAPGGPPTGQ